MSTAVALRDTASIAERAAVMGDLAQMTPQERLAYYAQVCKSTGLNPATRPFDYIKLNGRLVLYARKDATDQLRNLHGVSITSVQQEVISDVLFVTVTARNERGREDTDVGAVPIAGLKGENLANAHMKAVTKAKRRVTLSICGLGWLDETEVASIPDARPVTVSEDGEIIDVPQLPTAPAQPRWRWYIDMAVGEGCQATALDGSPCSMDSVEEVAIGGSAYYLCSRHAKQVRVAPTPPEVRNPDPEETEADI